jgi:hypothetical protein
VVHQVAGDAPFVQWASADTLIVGSWSGLYVLDPTQMALAQLTDAPVLAADLGVDDRVRWAETYAPDPSLDPPVMCLASCLLEVTSARRDGSDPQTAVPEVVANATDTFLQSPNGRWLAFQSAAHLQVLDLSTGYGVSDGPGSTWAMDVSDDGNGVMYLEATGSVDEPWPHFDLWTPATGDVQPAALEDDPSLVWTWRWRDGDHHALLVDTTDPLHPELALEALSTGMREWTLPLDTPVDVGTLHWSDDGRFLSFFQATRTPTLTVVDATTGQASEVGRFDLGDSVWDGANAVSPDGTRVAYLARGNLHLVDR